MCAAWFSISLLWPQSRPAGPAAAGRSVCKTAPGMRRKVEEGGGKKGGKREEGGGKKRREKEKEEGGGKGERRGKKAENYRNLQQQALL